MSDCSGAVKGDRVAVPADGSFPHTPPQNLPVSFRPLGAVCSAPGTGAPDLRRPTSIADIHPEAGRSVSGAIRLVVAIAGERFCRMWEYCLAAVQVGFRNGSNMVFQLLLSQRVDSVPIVRDFTMVGASSSMTSGDSI